MAEEGYRSLADQLRAWSDQQLSRLLLARPDLATPAPQDSGQLASRAATRASLMRALDQLSRVELSVLDALVVAGQTTPQELRSLVHADPAATDAALAHLRDLALAWESPTGLRALSGVADLLVGGPDAGVSGLRTRSAEPASAEEVAQRLAEISAAARTLLEHVLEQGGEATTGSSRHTVLPEDARTPPEELLARRLLVPRGGGSVVLPGEVGLVLRGGRTTTEPVDVAPEVPTSSREASLVDKVAAGAAFEAVRRVELLLDHWGTRPPGVLRSGGLGVRDLKATAVLLQVRAWIDSPRLPGLVGRKDPAGKTWNALVPELTGVHQVETRRLVLDVVGGLPAGEVLATGTGVPGVVARVAWLRPRRPRTRADQVLWAVEEAAALGVTGLGGLASYSRALVADDDAAPLLEPLLPAPVDHVLVQADLTAVAPGPLESTLARRLQVLAEVESRGGATVYRFTPGSVRRALDLGWTAVEVHDFLGEVSRTPVPQPLTYLVDDTARTFGAVRVGHAEAFLRADDESALAEILHHPQARSLGLRRIAPTVLVSDTPLDVLLPRLRDLGAAPVVEAPADSPSLTPSGSLAALREAIEQRSSVVIGYVDNHGSRSDRVVDPLGLEGGRLTAHDHRADDTRVFAVHRITSVRPVG